MNQDDLRAALERLLDPDMPEEEPVVPYWLMPEDARRGSPVVPGDLGPDLAAFLSDGLASATPGPEPSLADMAAYIDGRLGQAERDDFEAALVASPDLRAEVEALAERVAAIGHDDEGDVAPASDAAALRRARPDRPA